MQQARLRSSPAGACCSSPRSEVVASRAGRRHRVVASASLPPPGDGGEGPKKSVMDGVAGNMEILSSNLKKTIEYEKNRLVGDMDALIETSDIKIQKDIKSVSEEENKVLNFWSGTGISVAGGAVVVGLLILFIFVIGPPPEKV